VERPCFVDQLFDRSVGGAKAKAAEYPPNMHVSGNVDRIEVGEGHLEVACQDIGRHGRDLRAYAIELKKVVDDVRAARLIRPDPGGVACILFGNPLNSCVKKTAHRFREAVKRLRLRHQAEHIFLRELGEGIHREPSKLFRDAVRDEPSPLGLDLAIHNTGKHKGVGMPFEVIQQLVSRNEFREFDHALGRGEEGLPTLYQLLAYGVLGHPPHH
jgi:hypothetical protein